MNKETFEAVNGVICKMANGKGSFGNFFFRVCTEIAQAMNLYNC